MSNQFRDVLSATRRKKSYVAYIRGFILLLTRSSAVGERGLAYTDRFYIW